MTLRRVVPIACCVVAVLHIADFAVAPATAQDVIQKPSTPGGQSPARFRWEIEIHGGGTRSSHPADGTASLPNPGTPFVTISGLPSRRVSSWVFGDGAALLNQAHAVSPLRTGLDGVVPLDAVLNSASVRWQGGASAGVRVSRQLNGRLAAELSVDYGSGRLALTEDAVAGIEASRVSAMTTLRRMVLFSRNVTATASLGDRQGHQLSAIGTLNLNLVTRGRTVSFVTLGGGLMASRGGSPTASLRTEYSLESPPIFMLPQQTFTESDTVTVRYSIARHAPIFAIGGGVKYALSPRWTVRVEARGQFARNTLRVTVDADPHSNAGPQVPGSFAFATATNPSIQFSGLTGSILPALSLSSLSGPPLRDVVTFEGRGIQSHVIVTTGLAWRF